MQKLSDGDSGRGSRQNENRETYKNLLTEAFVKIASSQKEREKEYQLSKDKIIKTIQNFE